MNEGNPLIRYFGFMMRRVHTEAEADRSGDDTLGKQIVTGNVEIADERVVGIKQMSDYLAIRDL